jgi:hypothetical protein
MVHQMEYLETVMLQQTACMQSCLWPDPIYQAASAGDMRVPAWQNHKANPGKQLFWTADTHCLHAHIYLHHPQACNPY